MNDLKERISYAVSRNMADTYFSVRSGALSARRCPDIKFLYDALKAANAPDEEYSFKSNGCSITVHSDHADIACTPNLEVCMEDMGAAVQRNDGANFTLSDASPLDIFNRNISGIEKQDILFYSEENVVFFSCLRTRKYASNLKDLDFRESDTIAQIMIEGHEPTCIKILEDGFKSATCVPALSEVIDQKFPTSKIYGLVCNDVLLKVYLERRGFDVLPSKEGGVNASAIKAMKELKKYFQGIIDKHRSIIVKNTALAALHKDKASEVEQMFKGPIFSDTIDEIIDMVAESGAGLGEKGHLFPRYVDEDLLAMANVVYHKDEHWRDTCNAYGGPVLDFPIETTDKKINAAMFRTFQDILIRERCPYRLRFSSMA